MLHDLKKLLLVLDCFYLEIVPCEACEAWYKHYLLLSKSAKLFPELRWDLWSVLDIECFQKKYPWITNGHECFMSPQKRQMAIWLHSSLYLQVGVRQGHVSIYLLGQQQGNEMPYYISFASPFPLSVKWSTWCFASCFLLNSLTLKLTRVRAPSISNWKSKHFEQLGIPFAVNTGHQALTQAHRHIATWEFEILIKTLLE